MNDKHKKKIAKSATLAAVLGSSAFLYGCHKNTSMSIVEDVYGPPIELTEPEQEPVDSVAQSEKPEPRPVPKPRPKPTRPEKEPPVCVYGPPPED